jgi:hypothetical protein
MRKYLEKSVSTSTSTPRIPGLDSIGIGIQLTGSLSITIQQLITLTVQSNRISLWASPLGLKENLLFSTARLASEFISLKRMECFSVLDGMSISVGNMVLMPCQRKSKMARAEFRSCYGDTQKTL